MVETVDHKVIKREHVLFIKKISASFCHGQNLLLYYKSNKWLFWMNVYISNISLNSYFLVTTYKSIFSKVFC